MTVAEKLTLIAENEQRVFDAGYERGRVEGGYDEGVADGRQAEYDAFWDALQGGGAPRDYSVTFGAAWTPETFRPKHDLIVSNAYMMFRGSTMEIDLAAHLEENGVTLDLSGATNTQYVFNSSMFTRVGVIDLSGSTSTAPGDSLFGYCRRLKTIDKIILKTGARGEFTTTAFTNCNELENLSLEGNLTTDVDLHWSTRLSRASIESVYYAALGGSMDHGTYPTLTFSLSAVNAAYESAAGAKDGSESAAWQALVDGAPFTISLI